jgi:flagellar motor switch protein FliG
MTLVEKVLAVGLALLLLLLLFVLWKLNRMQSAEQQGLAKLLAQQQQLALPGMGAMALPSPQQTLESVEESRRKYLQTQESQVQDALLQESNERMAQDIVKQLVGRDDWKQDLIQEMTRDKQSMESLTQLLAVIGPETTRSLFGRVMPQDSFLELEQLARDAKVSTAEANTTLKNVAMFLLTRKLIAPEQPTTNLFGFLEEMSTGQVSYLLNDEPSKIKAIVISRLISEQAAEILHNLSKDERTLVAVELGRLSELPTKLVEQVAYNLADKARTVPDENSVSVDGIRFVADVLGDADPTTREELLNGLRVTDQKLSEEIESRCFIFDSIPFVPREVLVEVVRKLPPDVVVTAISGADKSIQEAVVLCFPEQTRKAIVSALKAKKPSAEEIREARQQFVKSMRSMSDANKVDLREVNSAFSHQESAPALSYEEQPA